MYMSEYVLNFIFYRKNNELVFSEKKILKSRILGWKSPILEIGLKKSSLGMRVEKFQSWNEGWKSPVLEWGLKNLSDFLDEKSKLFERVQFSVISHLSFCDNFFLRFLKIFYWKTFRKNVLNLILFYFFNTFISFFANKI